MHGYQYICLRVCYDPTSSKIGMSEQCLIQLSMSYVTQSVQQFPSCYMRTDRRNKANKHNSAAFHCFVPTQPPVQ
jgi:hypothetical protein